MAKVYTRLSIKRSVTIIYVVSVLTLLMSLPGISTSVTAGAALEPVKWSVVDIPAGGEAGGWVLAGGSDVRHLTMTADGTLYCYANPAGVDRTLFKSTDGGFTWSSTGEVTGPIVDIAVVPDNDTIYYATESDVYRSEDAGNSFNRLIPNPGGAGSGNVSITCIDVIRSGDSNIVAAGTADTDTAEYGGVYTLDESELFPSWLDSDAGDYDVYEVAYSPDYSVNRQLAALVTDEQDAYITSRVNSSDWGQVIGDARIEGLVPVSATIAFPDDYDIATEENILYVAIDTAGENGDVYQASGEWAPESSIATDLNVGAAYNLSNIDITGLAVDGNTADVCLLAGAAGSSRVYRSTDGGTSWKRSSKEPTGQSDTCLLVTPGYTGNGIAYAATAGTESALSRSTDGGMTWNQIGLIDTGISSGSIIDIALSPASQNGAIFMLTFCGINTEHSLWRNMNDEGKWERVYSSTLDNVDSLSLVELSPKYNNENRVVFLAGTGNGEPVMLKSTDNGQTYRQLRVPYSIDIWTPVNDNELFIGSYNGSAGIVCSTSNGGLSFSTGAFAGNQPLTSMALSPDYEQDGTILTGNTNGWVYYSSNNGTSFRPLPLDATAAPLDGSITVTFDSNFATNNIIYAVSNSADKGVYRFRIDSSTEWERIDGNLPSGGTLGQAGVSADGVLYAVDSQPVDFSGQEGGMERSLNPTYALGVTFETVIRGLDEGATLCGLWIREDQLWSIDTQNTGLVTYIDSLTGQVVPVSPLDEAPGTRTSGLMIEWETLSGATGYTWQLDYDTDFSTVPADFEGTTGASVARLPDLSLDTTYYWQVRASEPVLSRWSARQSFNTALGGSVIAPVLNIPEAGAADIPLKPQFQWSAMAGAESYELLVSPDASFSDPIIAKTDENALPANAWQSDIGLDYNTTYYWKVRAGGSGSYSDWSAVSIFTTELPPSEESPPPDASSSLLPSNSLQPKSSSSNPPPSPPSSSQAVPQVSNEWIMYLGGALLLAILVLLITLLIMMARTRRA